MHGVPSDVAGCAGELGAVSGVGIFVRLFQAVRLFTYASPERSQLLVLGRHDSIRDVGIVVLDGFNGPGAKMSIGTDADPERIVKQADITVAAASDYRIDRTYVADGIEPVELFLHVAGSTSGQARVYFEVMSFL